MHKEQSYMQKKESFKVVFNLNWVKTSVKDIECTRSNGIGAQSIIAQSQTANTTRVKIKSLGNELYNYISTELYMCQYAGTY